MDADAGEDDDDFFEDESIEEFEDEVIDPKKDPDEDADLSARCIASKPAFLWIEMGYN